MMDHTQVEELSAALALGAAEPEEVAAVSEHLASCTSCATTVAEMRAVALALPLACESVEPSRSLRGRIMEAARSDARAGERLRHAASSAPRPMAWPQWWTAAAAAVVVAGAGYAMGTMSAQNAAEGQLQAMRRHEAGVQAELAAGRQRNADIAADNKAVHGVVAAIAAGRVWEMTGGQSGHSWHCVVTQPLDRRNATLVASVPRAPHGMTYQAWIVHRGTAHDAGMLQTGVNMMDMPMPVEPGDVVAFTMEPPGGSAKPTMPWVMQQTLD